MNDRDDGGSTATEQPAGPQQLIWRCLDGVASEAEAAELSALVLRDPGIALELARAARMERNLEVASRMSAGEIPAPRSRPVPAAPRRRVAWAVGTGLAAVAAALALGWFLRAPRPSPDRFTGRTIEKTIGRTATARTTIAGTTIARTTITGPATRGATPAATAADAARRVHFADGSTAVLRDGDSRLETRVSNPQAIDVALTHGGARFEVVSLPSRRFRVWVAAATYVDVVGTVFSVERLAAGARVSVERGSVKIVSPHGETRISAGSAEVVAFESPRTHDTAAERAPERARPHAAEPRETVATTATDEAGALLRASANARRAGRPEDAAALLRRFLDRHPRDPRSAYAAFMLGRVLLEELGRPGEAALAFARVETLDPRTPLVEDALAREVESRARAGDPARAQERGRLYLDRYPNGARADEVRRYGRMK